MKSSNIVLNNSLSFMSRSSAVCLKARTNSRDMRNCSGTSSADGTTPTELRARTVRYLADRDVLEIENTRDGGFLIPRKWIGALQDIPVTELARLEVWPDGSAISLEARDIHISVDGLLTDILPALLPESALATIFARRGGQATSEAKRAMAINVSLTPQLEELVREKVSSGRYNSASEVVREALRLMDSYERVRAAALGKLRAEVEAGWQQVEEGRVRDFDPQDIKRRGREKLARQRKTK